MRSGDMLAQLLRFAIVGTFGFGVDSAVLYLAMWLFGLGPYSARLISFLVAASVTWICNRVFTFADADQENPLRQWRRFLATNAVGGVVNYATYALIVSLLPAHPLVPLFGLACGSVAGLVFNFTLSRRLVFTPAAS